MFIRFPQGIIVSLFALLLVACGGADEPDRSRGDRESRSSAIAVMEVTPRDLYRELSLSARVEPRVVVELASRTAGSVDEVRVEEGDSVSQGDVLATLDMSEARAELRRAEAEQETAQLDYQRVSELRERGVATSTEFQNARAALQVAESVVLLWRTRVDFGRITAPRDGVITAKYIEPGEAVQAQSVLFELAAMDELVMRVGVTERDVVHLSRGQTMPVRLDALPALDLEGTVRRIFPMARSSNRLITVEVALPGEAASLGVRAGFLGRIQTSVDRQRDAIAIPSFMLGLHEGRPYVYRVEDDKLHRETVETGVTRGEWTEILSGLEAGDHIFASNPMDMRDGQNVRVVSQWGDDD